MRIAILDAYDKPLAFIDNSISSALHYYDDLLHNYLKGTASTFEFKASAKHDDAQYLVEGNKLAFRYNNRPYYLNIQTVVEDEYEIEIKAYSLSLELLNEQKEPYKSETARTFEQYIKAFDSENTLIIGINEVNTYSRSCEWEGTETLLARIFSLANKFDAEIEIVPELNPDHSIKQMTLNVYHAHDDNYQGIGDKRDEILRYGKGIEGVRKTSDITSLYTAIKPVGTDNLTISSLNKKEYDENGDLIFESPSGSPYIYAHKARDRFPSTLMASENGRYIVEAWNYDTSNVNTLYGQALAELKKNCVPKCSYEVEGYIDANIGDTFLISDSAFNPPLYLSARVTEQEISFSDITRNKTKFDNFEELQSQIDDSLLKRVEKLLEERKLYTNQISSNNGTLFKNGIGTTTVEVKTFDGTERLENVTYKFYINGEEVR